MTNDAKANKNRCFSFNDSVLCSRTLHINNYTNEEVFNTWFTKQDYKEIKREVKLTVAMTMNKKKSRCAEGINFSSRGLEDMTASSIVQTAEHRFFAIDAVLDEQDCQWATGIIRPQELSLVYMEYSFVSHMTAFLIAAADEKLVLGYHDGGDITKSTTSTTAHRCKTALRQTIKGS